jgi:hypothetical protein
MVAKSEQNLLKEIETIDKRVKSRLAANDRDRASQRKLQEQLKRVQAKAMLGHRVVLNHKVSISNNRLREFRGVQGTVDSVGLSKFGIVFDGDAGPGWSLPFDYVVAATPENIALAGKGRDVDELTDMMNGRSK